MITERKHHNGLSSIDIQTPLCSASVCLHGAQILSWKPAGHEECLYTSPQAVFEESTPIRGGIPLCWPWFGKKENLPSHGVARTSIWKIDHMGIDKETQVASIHLNLFPDDEQLPIAFLRISLSNQLRMRLQTTARGRGGELTAAFHNYFNVGDVQQCKIIGLGKIPYEELGMPYAAASKKESDFPITLNGPIDRIYTARKPLSKVLIEDPVKSRTINVEAENTHSIVAWNPWEKGAKNISDLPDDHWKNFICVEPSITKHTPIILQPGQTHVMRQVISVHNT